MTEQGEPLGEKKPVELRTVWPNELDFSAWLGKNLDVLADELCWELDPKTVQREVIRGPLRVDLLVEATQPKEAERFPVVIENQLGMTDASHLAGVMTYMVAFEARGAIWIAGDVSHEYVETIQWLNDNSTIDAYLFKVETIRIDDSRPVPIFKKIVGPSKYARTGRSGGDPKRNQQVRDWWSRVLPRLASAHPAWQSARSTAHQYPGVHIPDAPAALSWYANVTENKSTIGIMITGKQKEESAFYFDQLAARQRQIHEAFGESLDWTSGPATRWITWRNPVPGGFADEPEVQEKAAAALETGMKRLVDATESVAREIPRWKLPSDSEEEGRDQNRTLSPT